MPAWLEPRVWEAMRVELGDRAACALDAEDRWGAGSALRRLRDAERRGRAAPHVVAPDRQVAILSQPGVAQNTPR